MFVKNSFVVAASVSIFGLHGVQAQNLVIPEKTEFKSIAMYSVDPPKEHPSPIIFKLEKMQLLKNWECYAAGDAAIDTKRLRVNVDVRHISCVNTQSSVIEMSIKAIVLDDDKTVGISGREISAGKKVSIQLMEAISVPSQNKQK